VTTQHAPRRAGCSVSVTSDQLGYVVAGEAGLPRRAAEDGIEFSIATAPATAKHRLLALAVVTAMAIAYVVTLPYGSIRLPRLDSFIPTVAGVIFITDLITAALLFAQFAASGSRSLLLLASGFLFSALIIVGYVLTFPGAFSPTGFFGAGPQSSAWVYLMWRVGFAASMALYAAQRSGVLKETRTVSAPRSAILWSVAIVTVLVCAMVFAFTAGQEVLPSFLSGQRQLPLARYFTYVVLAVNLVALILLARVREKSILDVWLMVAAISWLGEGIVVAFFFQERYSFAFYVIRLVGLPVSKAVLVVLLWETIRLYTNLAISNRELRRERAGRLTNAAAVAAAIAHEVRQPVTAMNLMAYAGQQSLDRATPDVSKAKRLFADIKDATLRTNEVFDSFFKLFQGSKRDLEAVDVNALTLEVRDLLRGELDDHKVMVTTDLASDLPVVHGHRAQFRAVIVNLIKNSIDAMASTTDRPRSISIATSRSGPAEISFLLQDTGPGIEPHNLASIFDPFVTTKAKGSGMGLAICKMIVDQHGGAIWAVSDHGGARFEIALPTRTAGPATRPAQTQESALQTID
jgi:signal transduction histidine kinase